MAKVRPKGGGDAYLIVFIEAQGRRGKDFLARVFRYFALLHIKFHTVVIPIVIYSDASRNPLPDRWKRYELGFAGHQFLKFRFLTVHPSSLRVRDCLQSHNPAQLALAARMNMENQDLTRTKLELLRQLAAFTLTEAQIEHAVRYIEAYLEENDPEAFQRGLALLSTKKFKETGMQFNQYFEKIGLEKGLMQGLEQGMEKGLVQGLRKGMVQGLEQGMAQGLEKGREEGLEMGLRQNAMENARRMLAEGFDWEVITRVTSIHPAELEAPTARSQRPKNRSAPKSKGKT